MTSTVPATSALADRRHGTTTMRPPGAEIPHQRRDGHFIRTPATPQLVDLARTGTLGRTVAAAGDAERRVLHAAAFAVCYPVVFEVVTRKVEQARKHPACRRGLRFMPGSCLDKFYDDVESLIARLLATIRPVEDLPAWLAYWAPRAAVDGHRRRRGESGALQRPRLTVALAAGLGQDPWLTALALEILIWVGVPATAGTELWPLDEWAQRRALITGDHAGSTPAIVAADVERVLAVMGERPEWFEAHVERPLGRKPTPVAMPPSDHRGDSRPLRIGDEHDVYDDHVAALAEVALKAIAAGLRGNGDPTAVVVKVLDRLFLGGSDAERLGRAPGAGPAHDERLSARLAEPAAVSRIVEQVLLIVRETE